jgi:hypothetical protein
VKDYVGAWRGKGLLTVGTGSCMDYTVFWTSVLKDGDDTFGPCTSKLRSCYGLVFEYGGKLISVNMKLISSGDRDCQEMTAE